MAEPDGGENKRKRGIDLDWKKLLSSGPGDDEPVPLVVIQKDCEKPKPVETIMVDGGECDASERDLNYFDDQELIAGINRLKNIIPVLSPKLPDRGEKLRASLNAHEAELKRRKLRKANGKGSVISLIDLPTHDNVMSGAKGDSPTGTPVSESAPKSTFATQFLSKMDENKSAKSVSKELSTLNYHEHKDCLPTERARRISLSSKESSFRSPHHLSENSNGSRVENEELPSSRTPASLPSLFDRETIDFFEKSSRREHTPQLGRRRQSTQKNKPVVLVDEEELEFVNHEACQIGPSSRDCRIYYPSRDDPEIEIHSSELENLAPESYLSSTIMNFYIRYLQKKASAEAKSIRDYHFFNTYFYEKLKWDVLNKGDREASFVKFRRWWKGINLFEKAYIFLPIYEKDHWSLVIICIPSKETERGAIVLHLDSLGFHISETIFRDVKSFLTEEWKVLKQEDLPPGFPIASHIWGRLSRRICERVVEVPQQENVYDCGLFVLYFLERFIEAAPRRLTKAGDLDMFGRQWFRPQEASNLRKKIKKLLIEEFNMQSKERTM